VTLDRFIAAFEVLSAELHVENLLDAIWLAQLDRKLILGETAIGAPVAVPNSAETKLTEDGRKPDSEITDVTEPERVEQNSASELSEMTPVYAPGAAEPASSTIKASSVAIPAGHALPGRLHFTRAMRPFSRKWPSRPESELDEERTVEVTADLGLDLYPIFRPVQEHWFDVDVVLEDDPAVLVWQDTLRDFCQLLRDTGAFRDVRRWRLHLEGKQPMLESLPGGGRSSVRVLNGIGIRRLVFFATHGSSPHWNDGVYAGILGGWRTESSIVVLQMQPRHRWKRSALGEAQGTAFALEPGVPTSALRVQAYWWSLAATEEEGTLVSVPVVPLAPSAISEWAQMQMARGRRCPAIFLDKDSSDNGVTSLLRSGPTGSATRLLKLLGESSPEAYRLAIYLASGPFTIPVARLVQEAMFAAAADQAHLADVLLCGCVAPRVGQESEADPNRIYYEFTPEARSILLRSLHEADAQQITQSLQDFVSRYIEQIYGRVITFKALVPDENGNYELPDWAQPFAKLGVSLLGLPAHGKSVRQLVQDFRSANVPAVVGEAARFARTGAKPRQNLARELVSAGLARRIPTGIEWLPGVETLLKEIPPLTGASILWVDDHPENILTAARRIREAGAAIHEVLSTGSAIEVLKNAAFDVIITDMTRGVQTTEGLDLIIQLKVQAIQAPVIIYTGKFAETGQDAARMVGAFGCTNDADALFGLIIEALTPGTERDTGTLDYQPEASEAILRAPGDRHTTFVNLLWVIKAYCNSAVNQLFVLQYGELVVVADVIDADKRRYVVASWEGIIGRAARERRPVWVNDVLVDADYIAAEPSSRSECVIPLLSDGEVLGVLNVEFTRANALTQQQVDWLVKFSQPLAAAIAVARRPRMLFVGRDQHLSRRIVTDLGRQGIQVEGLSSPDESLSPFTPVLLPISPASVERVRVATTWLRASWLIPLLLEDIPLPQALSAFVPFDFTRDYDAVFPELAKTLLLGGARAGSVAEALPNKVEQTPKPADITIEVPFATNRREQSDGGYGADRGELSYGVCTVNVPPVHRLGQLEQRSILRLEFRDNPEKHFMLVGLRRTPDLSQNDDRVLIFIHDWNMTLEGAVLRFAQIVYDLAADVTPILFSWPSQGQVTGYVADLQSADASAQQLSRVLASFTRSRSLALWAHGAGCRALLGALRDSAVTADHILFTMPDADEAWFRENMRVAQATRARVTVYTDPNANELGVARSPRSSAARSTRPIPGADLIVTNGVALFDIAQLLKFNAPPEMRSGLRAVRSESGIRWELSDFSYSQGEPQLESPSATVFIASTTADLAEHREIAVEAVQAAGCTAITYEPWSDGPTLTTSFARLEQADAVIVIVGNRIGRIPEDQPSGEQKSLTWLECEEAARLGKRVFTFIGDEARLESTEGGSGFLSWLRNHVIFSTFAGPEDLRDKLNKALWGWHRSEKQSRYQEEIGAPGATRPSQQIVGTATAAPSRFILLAGSRRSSPLARVRRQTEWAAEAVAKEIARAGFGLVCGTQRGSDQIAIAAFTAEMTARQLDTADALRIVTFTDDLNGATLPEGTAIQYSNDQVTDSLAHADAVVLLGGNQWVRQVAVSASRVGKRVFPIPGTGEAAAELFKEQVSNGIAHRDLPWSRKIERKEDAEAVATALLKELTSSRGNSDEEWITNAIQMGEEALEQENPKLAIDILRERPDLWGTNRLSLIIRAAVSAAFREAVKASFHEYAQQYEEIRRTQQGGASRTARMNALITESINAARSVSFVREFAQQLVEENHEGTRIIGIAVARARPYPEHVELATKIIYSSLSPFEQFHALLLARAVVDRASPKQHEALRSALLKQAGTPIHQSDRSRADIQEELLNKIDKEKPAPRGVPALSDYPLVTIAPPMMVSYNDDLHEHHGEFVITRGQHQLKLPAEFRIGRYPVTNQLFSRFVNDHGYENDRYWRENSRQNLRRDLLTKDGRTLGPATWESSGAYAAGCRNHPVSGINYLEAEAFVRWLQIRYPESGWDWCIPSEDMWELTARSPEGYRYPWGHEFQTGFCNSAEAGIGRPGDVTQFPRGESAYGCSDMAGNVWEYVESAERSPRTCVLRGGAYLNNQYEIASCFRLVRVPIEHRASDFGLRCAQVRNADQKSKSQAGRHSKEMSK